MGSVPRASHRCRSLQVVERLRTGLVQVGQVRRLEALADGCPEHVSRSQGLEPRGHLRRERRIRSRRSCRSGLRRSPPQCPLRESQPRRTRPTCCGCPPRCCPPNPARCPPLGSCRSRPCSRKMRSPNLRPIRWDRQGDRGRARRSTPRQPCTRSGCRGTGSPPCGRARPSGWALARAGSSDRTRRVRPPVRPGFAGCRSRLPRKPCVAIEPGIGVVVDPAVHQGIRTMPRTLSSS